MKLFKLLEEMEEWALFPISMFYFSIAIWFKTPIVFMTGFFGILVFDCWWMYRTYRNKNKK